VSAKNPTCNPLAHPLILINVNNLEPRFKQLTTEKEEKQCKGADSWTIKLQNCATGSVNNRILYGTVDYSIIGYRLSPSMFVVELYVWSNKIRR
jgi:hypothetical protein